MLNSLAIQRKGWHGYVETYITNIWNRGKGGKEVREENNKFKPTGRSLRQATLLLAWERKLNGREKVDPIR